MLDSAGLKCYNMLYVFVCGFFCAQKRKNLDTLAGSLPADVYKQYYERRSKKNANL